MAKAKTKTSTILRIEQIMAEHRLLMPVSREEFDKLERRVTRLETRLARA